MAGYTILALLFVAAASATVVPDIPFHAQSEFHWPSEHKGYNPFHFGGSGSEEKEGSHERHHWPWHHWWCDEGKFIRCARTFSKGIGVPMTKNATKWTMTIQEKYRSGELTLTGICSELYRYEGCIGDQEDKCFTTWNLARLGLSWKDANLYYVAGKQIAAQCAPDILPILIKEKECIVNVSQERIDDVIECASNYTASVKKHPENICEETKQYEDCTSEIYTECSDDTRYAMCRLMEANLSIQVPRCKSHLKCSKDDNYEESEFHAQLFDMETLKF